MDGNEHPELQLWPCCLRGKDDGCFQALPDDVVGFMGSVDNRASGYTSLYCLGPSVTPTEFRCGRLRLHDTELCAAVHHRRALFFRAVGRSWECADCLDGHSFVRLFGNPTELQLLLCP